MASQYTDLAAIERDAGRLEQARTALEQALDPELQRFAAVKDFGGRRLALARVLRESGRRVESARQLMLLHDEMAPLPPHHLRRAQALLEDAELATLQGESDAARTRAEAASQILSHTLPQPARDRVVAQANTLLARLGTASEGTH